MASMLRIFKIRLGLGRLIVLAMLLSGGIVCVYGQSPALAETVDEEKWLYDVGTARQLIREENLTEYFTYKNGSDVLYKHNNSWLVANNDTAFTVNKLGDSGMYYENCVSSLRDGYAFKVEFRIHVSGSKKACKKGTGGSESWHGSKSPYYMTTSRNHKGGRVKVTRKTPGLPLAMLIEDIDSKHRGGQVFSVGKGGVSKYYLVKSGDYTRVLHEGGESFKLFARGGLYSKKDDASKYLKDDGVCDTWKKDSKERKCNALVLFDTNVNKYTLSVSMSSPDGFMSLENNMSFNYRTVKFDMNTDAKVEYRDVAGTDPFGLIRTVVSEKKRDYVYGTAAGGLPEPARNDGYTFDGWYTKKSNGVEFKSTDIIDRNTTVYARWTSSNPGELTPSVDLDEGVVEPGETVDLIAKVSNSGGDVTADWRVVKLVLDPGVSPNKGADDSTASDQDPCAFYRGVNSGSPCDSAYSDNGRIFTGPSTEVVSSDETVPMDYGKTVCYGLAVNPYKAGGSWRYSRLKCFTIAKKPKVQVWGGNLSVGKSFDGTLNGSAAVEGLISSVRGNSFGSWIEYSILAPNKVSRVGSGVGLGGGVVYGADAKQWNQLTYANTDFEAGKSYGYYDTQDSSLPDPSGLAEKYNLATGTVVSGEYDVQTLRAGANRIVKLDGSGNLTIRGAGNTLAKGEWLVVDAPDSDVVISDDISYANEDMASADDLPQLVIRAKNITINGGVTNIDAWLVAGDTIKTCDKTEGLTVSDCSNQLRVNGPVISKSLVLARTGGDSTSPAEIFNLRPDAYLWMYNLASGHADYKVDYVRELPPRY